VDLASLHRGPDTSEIILLLDHVMRKVELGQIAPEWLSDLAVVPNAVVNQMSGKLVRIHGYQVDMWSIHDPCQFFNIVLPYFLNVEWW
jgi:hypothetical protein